MLFMAFFATLAIFGTERVDLVNRIMVGGLALSFVALLGLGLPNIDSQLLARADYAAIWPSGISVGILSFGAQNVVPTLLNYLGGDARRTKKAVLIGSLIPLFMYSAWEAVFLGNVPYEAGAQGAQRMQVLQALGGATSPGVEMILQVFSACAIASSMAGASVSLVDFFEDAISSRSTAKGIDDDGAQLVGPSKRVAAAALALAPPLALAFAFPDAFLGALENAGLLGGVSLYGLLPGLRHLFESVLASKRRVFSGMENVCMPSGGYLLCAWRAEASRRRLAACCCAVGGMSNVSTSRACLTPVQCRPAALGVWSLRAGGRGLAATSGVEGSDGASGRQRPAASAASAGAMPGRLGPPPVPCAAFGPASDPGAVSRALEERPLDSPVQACAPARTDD